MSLLKRICVLVFLLFSTHLSANPIVSWESSEGMLRFQRSEHKVDFFKLANHFREQPDGVVCGPTTLSIILNAFRAKKKYKPIPRTQIQKKLTHHIPKDWDPTYRYYTPHNVFTKNAEKVKTRSQVYGEPIKGKSDFGFQLRQLHHFVKAHNLNSLLRVVNDKLPKDQIKKEIIKNLSQKNNYVIINYQRKILGQKGGGHISPLGAYDKTSNSFLILDVTVSEHNWVWVPVNLLIKAMKTFDTLENRGYLLVTDSQ